MSQAFMEPRLPGFSVSCVWTNERKDKVPIPPNSFKFLYGIVRAMVEASSICAISLQMLLSKIKMDTILNRYLTLKSILVGISSTRQNCYVF